MKKARMYIAHFRFILLNLKIFGGIGTTLIVTIMVGSVIFVS